MQKAINRRHQRMKRQSPRDVTPSWRNEQVDLKARTRLKASGDIRRPWQVEGGIKVTLQVRTSMTTEREVVLIENVFYAVTKLCPLHRSLERNTPLHHNQTVM